MRDSQSSFSVSWGWRRLQGKPSLEYGQHFPGGILLCPFQTYARSSVELNAWLCSIDLKPYLFSSVHKDDGLHIAGFS